jgi:two-component system CheB/CheR fusion protein
MDVERDANRVLETLMPVEKDIQTEQGACYHVRLMPYRTLENVIDGVVITFVDITMIKQSEELRRLATVVRDSNDAITLQGLDGSIRTWNRGAEIMYGYSEKEALKMNITQLVPMELRKESLDMIKKIERGEDIKSFRTKRLTKTGKILDVWLTVTKLTDNSGDINAVATTERDVTGGGIKMK